MPSSASTETAVIQFPRKVRLFFLTAKFSCRLAAKKCRRGSVVPCRVAACRGLYGRGLVLATMPLFFYRGIGRERFGVVAEFLAAQPNLAEWNWCASLQNINGTDGCALAGSIAAYLPVALGCHRDILRISQARNPGKKEKTGLFYPGKKEKSGEKTLEKWMKRGVFGLEKWMEGCRNGQLPVCSVFRHDNMGTRVPV